MPADTSIPSSIRARPRFLRAATDVEHRTDGTLILRSPEPLKPHARCMGEYIERWGREKPETTFLAQRAGDGWRSISWGETLRRVRAIASGLLKRRLSQSKPIAILSDNSIEHELLTLGAMHAGIPVVPISPAYSLMSNDFNRLQQAIALMDPGMVFADDIEKFAPAL